MTAMPVLQILATDKNHKTNREKENFVLKKKYQKKKLKGKKIELSALFAIFFLE
jgi:hypothetical protein